MTFSNKIYNLLKPIALIWLPGAATLYAAVAGIWGLGFVEQVVGTVSAIDTFLGVALHLSSSSYSPPSDGKLVIDKSDPAKDTYSLVLSTPVSELANKDTMSLKVTPAA